MVRTLGFVLLTIGFFGAAFAAVYRQELPSDKWMTVPWHWYLPAMAVGIVGVVMLRVTAKQAGSNVAKNLEDLETLRKNLDVLRSNIEELIQSQDKLSPPEIVNFIDDRMDVPFAEFADARRAMVHQFNLQVYADVMTEFASGERFTNRAWSAAADGYVDEVRSSLERAQIHLESAGELLQAAGEGSPATDDLHDDS